MTRENYNDIEITVNQNSKKIMEHEIILKGRPEDRKDLGIVGVINDLEELVNTIKSFTKPLLTSLVTFIIISMVQKFIEIYNLLQQLTPP